MPKTIETTISLHRKQFDAYNFSTQFAACVCGVQSGKTFVGTVWVQKKINEYPSGVGLICAPTVKILNHSTLEKFFLNFPEYRRYYREQKAVIELPTGGKIFVRSTDDPLGMEGMTPNWIWADEAGMMKRMTWLVMKARVSTTRGQIFLTTTPYNLGWLYQELFVPWKEGTDPDVSIFTWKSTENPFFPQDYYDKEKTRLRPEEFARRYDGEFTRLEGLVWEVGEKQLISHSDAIEGLLRYPDDVVAGVDWGFHNPAAIVVAKVRDAVFYIVDEWKASEKTTAEIVEIAKQLKAKWGIRRFFPDPAEPDRIEEMRRAGLPLGGTNKDVPVGLSRVASLLREQKLLIFDTCKELIDEVSQYQYEEGVEGKPLKEEPKKVNDHLCDALRYLVMGTNPPKPTTLLEKMEAVQKMQALVLPRRSRKNME